MTEQAQAGQEQAQEQKATETQDQATETQETKTPAAEKSEGTLLGGEETKTEEKTKEGKEEGKEETKTESVPEKYEIKVPEGMTLDEESLNQFTPVFKELNLTNEQAQKLADAYAPVAKQAFEAQQKQAMDAFKAVTDGWKDETVKILGVNKDKELAFASKAVAKFAGADAEAVKKLLNDTGVGNHPLLTKLFIAVGKTIAEDAFPTGQSKATGDPLASMYPTMD